MPTMDHLLPNAVRVAAIAVMATGLTACLSGGGGGSSETAYEPPLVRTTLQGDVKGVKESDFVSFKGIPYAQPPLGDLRFAAPQPAAAWTDVLEADSYASDCPQTGVTNEDCLYLNVYSPLNEGPHPVMVWIHGGAFVFGTGGETYVPNRLVSEDVVVVSINYRLGRFGFLAHPGLSAETANATGAQPASGSQGIMDQQLALKWVQDNIEAFGGDPDNVTIFGESAGGLSVLSHLVSPASNGLFDKAIVQSGSYSAAQTPLAAAEATGTDFAETAGCGAGTAAEQVACLRSKSVSDLQAAGLPTTLTPNLRPDILPLPVNAALQSGNFAKVPMIMGTNTEEWSYFFASRGEENPITAANQLAAAPVLAALGANADVLYPLAAFDNDYAKRAVAVMTDYVFSCPASVQADLVAANSNAPVYVYEFADRNAPPIIDAPSWLTLGATHASEIQYIFGSDAGFGARASDEQVELAQTMTRAWADFAHGDDPRSSTLNWVPYVSGTGEITSFETPDVQPLNRAGFRAAHRCAVWAPES
ncbi:carboxylesterase/lipase family protein [Halopseudomonas salegens]|uniref:Carboxylic ester hydrolase n=1 Tax=Halopseudomonas salegens TaxID=1434072 RepID=A0A1H2H0F1_9GAMM|nr:carboxylesterase family protein [Halopseudomonas salegens]SDU25209.1 para-nitrobenzyl esterase [Halopseudomonas salegens]